MFQFILKYSIKKSKLNFWHGEIVFGKSFLDFLTFAVF